MSTTPPPEPGPESESLLSPREVAARFGVASATVARWARAGHIPAIRIPSGHRRYRESDLAHFLNNEEEQ